MNDDIIKSYVGYLRDCALATLRATGLENVFGNKDAVALDLPSSALKDLAEGEYFDDRQEMWDLAIRLELADEEEEQLFLGVLFFVGRLATGRRGRRRSYCAPLLMTRLRARREHGKQTVVLEAMEDEFRLNLGLLANLVDEQDEEELSLRFRDVLDQVPGWPDNESIEAFLQAEDLAPQDHAKGSILDNESIEAFLEAVRRAFEDVPGFDKDLFELFRGFRNDPLRVVIDLDKAPVVVSNAAIFVHSPTPDMTVVRELRQLADMDGLQETVLSEIIRIPRVSLSSD